MTTLAEATGARPVEMDAEAHDATVAGISHLPLVLAAALVESVAASAAGAATWRDAHRLAATGWSDMTRLARGDPEMGAGILVTNADAVAKRLRTFRDVLDQWIEGLDGGAPPDADAVRTWLDEARHGARSGARRMSQGELVLVIPRASIMADPGWLGVESSGFDHLSDLAAFEALVAREGQFRPRERVEVDRSWKQVIPYLVLRDGERYFLMHRTKAGTDARLHDLYSIGIGGHLNPGDGDLAGGLRREWREELWAGFEPSFELIGLLNDDTTDVGSVHLGAVYAADAHGQSVAIRETDKLAGGFAEPSEVAAVVERMESWSALVFEHLEGVGAIRR